MIEHVAFRKSNGGISYIGINADAKQYSTQFYANVGLMNCHEVIWLRLKDIKRLLEQCKADGYDEVTYL